MSEEIVLKRLKDTLDVLIGKNVITKLDFQIRNMVEDCIKVIEKQQKELDQEKEKNKELKKDISKMYYEETIINILQDEFNLTRIEAKELLEE